MQVSLFLRRIGLKQYVDTFRGYNVDGRALILLDEEDYENLHITSRVHIRKIQVRLYSALVDAVCTVCEHGGVRATQRGCVVPLSGGGV